MSDAVARFVETFRSFCEDSPRDLWVFDHHGYEHLYIGEDVSDVLECFNISQFIDNKRLGYVARDTYETLCYADYGYTVRGLNSFGRFQTSVGDYLTRILADFDRGTGRDFAALHDRVCALNNEFGRADLFSDPTARDRLP